MYSLVHTCVCLAWFLFMSPFQINGEEDAKEILKKIAVDSGRELTESHLSEILACANDQTGCDKTLQTVLNNEIKLRGSLYEVLHDCLRDSQEPPPDIDKSISDYIDWQERIIKRGHNKTHNVGYCNPFRSLQCLRERSRLQRCECIIARKINRVAYCAADYGTACSTNVNSKFYDPLSFMAGGTLSKNSTTIPTLALCFNRFGVDTPKETCTRLFYFNEPMCLNMNLTQKTEDLDKYFSGVTTLSLGEPCNQAEEKQLYTVSDEEKMTMATRLQALENLKNEGRTFCDTRKFVTCGSSNKCECKFPAIMDKASGKCVLQLQFNDCDMKDGANDIDPNRTFVAIARRNFIDAYSDLLKPCPGRMSCNPDKFNPDVSKQQISEKIGTKLCNCGVPDKTGLNCDIQLADLMIPPRLRALPMDVPSNDEKWAPFIELNNKAIEFSKKQSLKIGDSCNLDADDAVKYFIAKLRRLVRIPDINLTMADYVNLTQQVEAFTNGPQKVCSQKPNARGVFERCHNQTNKCFAAENQQKDIQYMISRFDKRRTLLCGGLPSEIVPELYKDGEYLSSITTLELLLLNGTRYCAAGLAYLRTKDGFLVCDCSAITSGKAAEEACCEKAKRDLDKLLGININEKSSVHSMHGQKNWIQKTVWMSIILLTVFLPRGGF